MLAVIAAAKFWKDAEIVGNFFKFILSQAVVSLMECKHI